MSIINDDNNNNEFPERKAGVSGGGVVDNTYLSVPFLCAIGSIFCENRQTMSGKQRISLLSLLTDILVFHKVRSASSLVFRVLANTHSKDVSEIFSNYAETFKEEASKGFVNPKRFRPFRSESLTVNDKENRFIAIDHIMADSDFVIIVPALTRKEMNEFPLMKPDSTIDVSSEAFYSYIQAMEKSYPMFVVWSDGEVSENKMIL